MRIQVEIFPGIHKNLLQTKPSLSRIHWSLSKNKAQEQILYVPNQILCKAADLNRPCQRKGHLLRFQSNSTATTNGCTHCLETKSGVILN